MKDIKVDVVIIGGGTAGTFCALHLVRKGFKVALIEKTSKIGGALVNSLVYPTAGFHTLSGKYIYSPLSFEFIKRSIENGLSKGHIRDPLNFAHTITPINPLSYKIIAKELMNNDNFLFLPFSSIKNIDHKNFDVKYVDLISNGESYRIFSNFFVDASGILITSFFLPIEYFFDYQNIQAFSLLFKVSNVNFEKCIKDIKNNPNDFYHKTDVELMEKQNFLSVSGYFSLAKEFFNNSELKIKRDRFLFFSFMDKDTVLVNTTRLFLEDLLKDTPKVENDVRQNELKDDKLLLNKAEVRGYGLLLKQVFYIHKIMKENIGAFRDSFISDIADMVGIRQWRNVKGEFVLSVDDVVKGVFFDDTIAVGTWPIDIHTGKGIVEKNVNEDGYGIPFRSCISNFKNLVFIGKNISADNYAFSSLRIQGTMMIMGENIGRIIEYCLKRKTNFINLNYSEIKKTVEFKVLDTSPEL